MYCGAGPETNLNQNPLGCVIMFLTKIMYLGSVKPVTIKRYYMGAAGRNSNRIKLFSVLLKFMR